MNQHVATERKKESSSRNILTGHPSEMVTQPVSDEMRDDHTPQHHATSDEKHARLVNQQDASTTLDNEVQPNGTIPSANSHEYQHRNDNEQLVDVRQLKPQHGDPRQFRSPARSQNDQRSNNPHALRDPLGLISGCNQLSQVFTPPLPPSSGRTPLRSASASGRQTPRRLPVIPGRQTPSRSSVEPGGVTPRRNHVAASGQTTPRRSSSTQGGPGRQTPRRHSSVSGGGHTPRGNHQVSGGRVPLQNDSDTAGGKTPQRNLQQRGGARTPVYDSHMSTAGRSTPQHDLQKVTNTPQRNAEISDERGYSSNNPATQHGEVYGASKSKGIFSSLPLGYKPDGYFLRIYYVCML